MGARSASEGFRPASLARASGSHSRPQLDNDQMTCPWNPAMPSHLRSLLVLVLTLAVLSSAVAWQAASTKTESADEVLPVLREGGPRYYKGNLHTHSFWSDGDDFPEMIADWYRRH